MSERLDHARRYQEAIRGILLREWDPIGIADEPDAQDEYDGYIHEITGCSSATNLGIGWWIISGGSRPST